MKMDRTQNGVKRPTNPWMGSPVRVLDLSIVSPPPVAEIGSQTAADGTNTPPGRGSTNVPQPDNMGPRMDSGDMGLGVM